MKAAQTLGITDFSVIYAARQEQQEDWDNFVICMRYIDMDGLDKSLKLSPDVLWKLACCIDFDMQVWKSYVFLGIRYTALSTRR